MNHPRDALRAAIAETPNAHLNTLLDYLAAQDSPTNRDISRMVREESAARESLKPRQERP